MHQTAKSFDYQYDPLARLRTETYTDSETVTYDYDKASNLKTKTDQNGSALAYTYDSLYRLTNIGITRGTGVVGTTAQTFAYDDTGRLTNVTDNNDPTDGNDNSDAKFYFDAAGSLTKEEQDGKIVQSSYDANANRTALSYPGGKSLTLSYDYANRLTKISDGNTLATYDYDKVNNALTKTFGNGATASYSYDNAHRLTKLDHQYSGNRIVGFEYSLDAVGDRITEKKLHDADKSQAYVYDNASRLTSFKRGTLSGDDVPSPDRTQVWDLDAVSNWTKITTDSTPETRAKLVT